MARRRQTWLAQWAALRGGERYTAAQIAEEVQALEADIESLLGEWECAKTTAPPAPKPADPFAEFDLVPTTEGQG